MKLYLTILLAFFSHNIFAQSDTIQIAKFVSVQYPEEQKFISFLKANQLDSCVAKLSPEVIAESGQTEIRTELKKIYNLYKKYGEPKYSSSIGQGYGSVGTFGHDVRGTFEKACEYVFKNKSGEDVYKFILYYWNDKNLGVIKYFQTYDFSKAPNKYLIQAAPEG